MDCIHHHLDGLGIILTEYHAHHHIARRGSANHQRAQQPFVLLYIIKGEMALFSEVVDEVADLVA